MEQSDLIHKAREAFGEDLAQSPALTLRGANAVDSYERPEPYDAEADAPADAYLEQFTFWAMPYLDARSWRHYLPRLIEYAQHHPDDPAMVVEATVRSLRPPDRVPARLTTLTRAQEAVITTFLERLALDERDDSLRPEALQALEEWWLPGAHLRREVVTPRGPTTYREVGDGPYRLTIPDTMDGGGAHVVASERRAIEIWRGAVCGDALADVFVNVESLEHRPFGAAEDSAVRWLTPDTRAPIAVPGARRALRLDGSTFRYSPAEPERTTMVIAQGGRDVVTLTVRATERADVQAEMDRVIRSFALRAVTNDE